MNKSILQLKQLFEETITTLSIAEVITAQTIDTYEEYSIINNYDTVLVKSDLSEDLLCWDRSERSEPRIIRQSEIVSDSTPLLEVVRLLVQKKRLFVNERNQIKYVVTLSDLEKMPVRIWLFGIISLTEMELKNLVANKYMNNLFLEKMTEGRKNKTVGLFEEKRKNNNEVRLVDCLQYCDLESIIKKSPEIMSSFSAEYRKSDFNILSEAEDLRNMLAHSQKIEMSWENILKLTELLESLLNDIIE